MQKLNPDYFAPYYKQWFSMCHPEGLLDAHLECSLIPGQAFNASGWVKSEALALHNIFESPIKLRQILCKGDAAYRQGVMELKNAEFSLPGITIKGNLAATGFPQSPAIDAHISTNSIAWKTIKETLPESLLKQSYPDVTSKIADGAVELKNLQLKTSMSPERTTTLELLDGQ